MIRHGWVIPLPNGLKARCGGPAICKECQKEFFAASPAQQQAFLNRKVAEKKNEPDTNRVAAMEGKRAWREKELIENNPYPKDSSAFFAWEQAFLAADNAYLFSNPEGL